MNLPKVIVGDFPTVPKPQKQKKNVVWVNPKLPIVRLKKYRPPNYYNNRDNIRPLEK